VLEGASHSEWAACLSVTDDGTGMDAETLARARDPLFTTKPEGQGTGLGLTAVVRIIESHGGRVEINSEAGRGTQVRMLLPASPRKPEAMPLRRTGFRPPSRAVVISGDDYSRELLVATLEDAGLDVQGLESADELPRAEGYGQHPDVLVVEWAGNEADALAMLRQIRGSGGQVPIVLIADTGDPAYEAELAELALLVARPAPLGELGALARRLSQATPVEIPA